MQKEFAQVRLHLVSFFRQEDIIQNSNNNIFVKKDDFDEIVKNILNITFDIDC